MECSPDEGKPITGVAGLDRGPSDQRVQRDHAEAGAGQVKTVDDLSELGQLAAQRSRCPPARRHARGPLRSLLRPPGRPDRPRGSPPSRAAGRPTQITSLTFIATQSMPTVSQRPSRSATTSLVPTPSVLRAMPGPVVEAHDVGVVAARRAPGGWLAGGRGGQGGDQGRDRGVGVPLAHARLRVCVLAQASSSGGPGLPRQSASCGGPGRHAVPRHRGLPSPGECSPAPGTRSRSPCARASGARAGQHHRSQACSVRGIGPERAVSLDQLDQGLRGERRGERGRGARPERSPLARRKPPAPQPRSLQRRGAHDHRQGDRAREHVGVLAGEPAPAGDRQGGAVPRDAWGECRRLRATQGEPVEHGGLAAVAALRAAIRGDHRRRPGQQPGGGRQRAAEVTLDAALEGEAAEGRG